jgi:DUF1365 family protein
VPKSVGYEQNPLSVYYCYDVAAQEQDEDLKMCIAEVRPLLCVGFILIGV